MNSTKPHNTRALIASALTLLLAACTTPSQTNSPPIQTNRFTAEGKIALRYPECDQYRGCKQQAVSATIHWTHTPNTDTLELFDPTGQQALKLAYHGEQVTITNNKGDRTLTTAELEQQLGMNIPIKNITTWLFTPQPTAPFTEAGWKIAPQNWQNNHYQRLTLTRKDYYIRLILNNITSP